jgi:predicted dehydrogenase
LCAEPFRHPELAEAVAAAGKHMIIEKPMASDLEGAARIVRAVEEHGVKAMPAYNLRFNPVAERVKELVDAGVAGRIARVRRLHGHFMEFERGRFDVRQIADFEDWRDPRAERRDSLFFAGSHSALWFRWMFGSPESVQCMTTTATPGLPVEDNSVVLLRYSQRFAGIMESSETMLAQGAVTEIYGTEGVILQLRGNLPSTRVWNRAMTPLMVFRRETEEWELPALPPQFLRHERRHSSFGRFFDALLRDEPVPTDVYDGYDSIAILTAAEESTKQGWEVQVESWPRARSDEKAQT